MREARDMATAMCSKRVVLGSRPQRVAEGGGDEEEGKTADMEEDVEAVGGGQSHHDGGN
jgi:hypothetical protein